MKIVHKLTLGYLIVASIAGSTAYFALQSYININASFERLMSDPAPTLKALNDLKFVGNRIVSAADKVELTYAESERKSDSEEELLLTKAEQQFIVSGKEYDQALKNYRELLSKLNDLEKKPLKTIESAGSNLVKTSAELIALKKKRGTRVEILEKEKEFEEQQKVYFEAIDQAQNHEYDQLTEERGLVQNTITESTRTTLIVTLLTFTLAICLGLLISRSIARRIIKLKMASENVGHGELDTIIKIESNDEISALARSFNKMVNDLQKSQTELISSKNFVNNIISSTADSIIVLDMDLKVVQLNRAACNLTGFSERELTNQTIQALRPDGKFFSHQDVEELQIKRSVSGIETFWITKDGREVPILFSASTMYDLAGAANGIVCVAQDITVRKTLETQLSHQALHDSLTKLANRVLFRNRIEHALARNDRKQEPIAVLFLDLDNFKTVNDTLGHEAGDILLISVAERLVACLRPSDTVARLGGDEFAVLLENISHAEEVNLIAERLNDVLRESFHIDGKEIFVNTSIGVVTSANRNESIEDLLRNADVAMYKAKSQGKDRYIVFEEKMREDLIERVEFEADLRRAIQQQEFVLHYQPIINLQSKQMIGMEALVRWNHSQQGLIAPDKFIPIAEETGMIIPLGLWVLEEACQQASKWKAEFNSAQDLSITVNLSNKQVQEENLVQQVALALTKSQLPARNLILEITESTMLHDTEATIKKLTELKTLGIRLAIDDFGIGYSSLSYLQRFPIDVLKIDRSFVDKINQGKEGAAVARAIITMSETLHLKTIAEGIETDGQNTALQVLGCEFGQGYHFARPLTTAAMNEFLGQAILDEKSNLFLSQMSQPAAGNQTQSQL